jgi:hypothetical protein
MRTIFVKHWVLIEGFIRLFLFEDESASKKCLPSAVTMSKVKYNYFNSRDQSAA